MAQPLPWLLQFAGVAEVPVVSTTASAPKRRLSRVVTAVMRPFSLSMALTEAWRTTSTPRLAPVSAG